MTLKTFKILFIFLLTVSICGCSADEDEEASFATVNYEIDDFVITQPWWIRHNIVASDENETITDTLMTFPSQQDFTTQSVNYVFGLQMLAADVVKSFRGIVKEKDNNWMNYYTPYLGVFVSSLDSRPKQWELKTDVDYQNEVWPYHLIISDMPKASDDKSYKKALEIYYDYDFKNGIMFFSPTHFNSVKYPEKIVGHDMVCKLTFSNNDDVIENTLWVCNNWDSKSCTQMGNLYLNIKYSNNMMSFAALVDMPCLWFDKTENRGYSVALMGGIDCALSNVAIIPAFCSNSNRTLMKDNFPTKSLVSNSLPECNKLWNAMMEIDESQLVVEEYKTPVFMSGGIYVGAGREISERNNFTKALSKAQDVSDSRFDITPYKLSLLQIEW